MPKHFARYVLLPDGWAENVRIYSDDTGIITSVTKNAQGHDCEILDGNVIPGMANLHSHAFQRAMAGLTEYSANKDDSFWSWRDLMYKFALKLTPEDIGTIAAQLYLEMLKVGITQVGEFHYLHHDLNGAAYSDKAATSHAVINAAQSVGIGITHIPVLYTYGGFKDKPPSDEQRRFINNIDGILAILQELKNTYKNARNVNIGLSHHSLRAVSKKEMIIATEEARKIFPDLSIHIHIAEQMKEVQECEQVHSMRPVEYLFDSINVDEKWCLVHATHMNDNEIKMLAKSGAVAGLCPTTEANLGDGIFNLTQYMKHAGKFGIGSDSNTSVSVSEELRLLEYSQRLKHQRRNLACDEKDNHVGAYLFKNAAKGGAQALGIQGGEIRVGARADFVSLYDDNEILCGKEGDTILDSYVFAGNKPLVSDVILGGKTIIRNSHHPREYDITLRFKKLMYRLNS